ncbi:hypothetical protein [Streptomyces sp. NPDC058701]
MDRVDDEGAAPSRTRAAGSADWMRYQTSDVAVTAGDGGESHG